MTRENGTQNRGLLAGFSPLAGVSAGTAAVLFVFGVLCLAWHRVAAQVSTGITVLVYVVITVVCGLALAALVYVVLWLRHRVRYPELLVRRPASSFAPVSMRPSRRPSARPCSPPRSSRPACTSTRTPSSPPIMEQQVAVTQLPPDDQDQRPA